MLRPITPPPMTRKSHVVIWSPLSGTLSRMLKKSASGVLATLRGSTYRSVRLASSLAAALLDGLFEHPVWCTPVLPDVQTSEVQTYPQSFSAACYPADSSRRKSTVWVAKTRSSTVVPA